MSHKFPNLKIIKFLLPFIIFFEHNYTFKTISNIDTNASYTQMYINTDNATYSLNMRLCVKLFLSCSVYRHTTDDNTERILFGEFCNKRK